MPKPVSQVMSERLREAPAPTTHDRLGRPINGPCLIWTASADRKGYGVLGNREFGTTAIQRAHRAAYALAKGVPLNEIRTIPELDHLCRVKLCCSPSHLDPVTHEENIRRGDWRSPYAGITHCASGHRFTEENTYRDKRGHRYCRACKRRRQRERYAREVAAGRAVRRYPRIEEPRG